MEDYQVNQITDLLKEILKAIKDGQTSSHDLDDIYNKIDDVKDAVDSAKDAIKDVETAVNSIPGP